MRTLSIALHLALTIAFAGCNDEVVGTDARPADTGMRPPLDGSSGMDSEPDCVENPHTHLEIINACTSTSVQRVEKHPSLPLLYPDGGVPPLP